MQPLRIYRPRFGEEGARGSYYALYKTTLLYFLKAEYVNNPSKMQLK